MALILSRRVGEAVYIRHDIIVRVLEVSRDGGSVRLGVEKPAETPLYCVAGWNERRCDVCGDRISRRNEGQSSDDGVVCACCLGRMKRYV